MPVEAVVALSLLRSVLAEVPFFTPEFFERLMDRLVLGLGDLFVETDPTLRDSEFLLPLLQKGLVLVGSDVAKFLLSLFE